MERIKRLNWYQKSILIFMFAMALVFAVVYHMTIAREFILFAIEAQIKRSITQGRFDDRARGRFVSERDFCSR